MQKIHSSKPPEHTRTPAPAQQRLNLQDVRRDIARIMIDPNHDDGSYGPLFIRLAWHVSGTYNQSDSTGGSNGGTMRFPVERADPENAGFAKAFDVLGKIQQRHPWLSYADLYVLAGYVALEESGGPRIAMGIGRRDYTPEEAQQKYGPSLCPFGDGIRTNPNGSRLPSADLGSDAKAPPGCPMHVKEKPTIDAIRGVFSRLGLTDKETVCLIILGHQFGRCHLDVSGYEHPWYAFDPSHWNAYESGLGYPSIYQFSVSRNQQRERVTSEGKRQYELSIGGPEPFMMLPVDMALWWCEKYRPHVIYYDNNRRIFRSDAAIAFKKLTELGCEGLLAQEEIEEKPLHNVRSQFEEAVRNAGRGGS